KTNELITSFNNVLKELYEEKKFIIGIVLSPVNNKSGMPLPLARIKLLKINQAIEDTLKKLNQTVKDLTDISILLKKENIQGLMFIFLQSKQNILDTWDRIKNLKQIKKENYNIFYKHYNNFIKHDTCLNLYLNNESS